MKESEQIVQAYYYLVKYFGFKNTVAATAEPWAMFDKAIIGHSRVVPACVAVAVWLINSKSIAFVMWCKPVITSGA